MNPQHTTHTTPLEGLPLSPSDSYAPTREPASRDEDRQPDDVSRQCHALLMQITAFSDWPCDAFKPRDDRKGRDA